VEVVMANDTERPRALLEISPDLARRFADTRVVLATLAAVGGAIALFVGYLGVSGTLDPAKQLPYLVSGGVGGLFLLGVAAVLFHSADLSAVRDELAEVKAALARIEARLEPAADDSPEPQSAGTARVRPIR
jgi:hypothetical protein